MLPTFFFLVLLSFSENEKCYNFLFQDIKGKRNPQLVPFSLLDEGSRHCAKESARDVLGTLLGFGYTVEQSEQQQGELLTQNHKQKE